MYEITTGNININSINTELEIANPLSLLMAKYDKEITEPYMGKQVSIIMPSYNEAEFIERACASIYNQTIIDKWPGLFEFILVDSGSTDGTVEIARKYVDRVIIAGKGKLTARNEATAKATGDIIVSVDADCIYPDGWLNTLIKPLGTKVDKIGKRYNKKTDAKRTIIATCGSTIDLISYISISDYYFNQTVRYRMAGRNSAYFKDMFYLAGGFNNKINQTDPTTIIGEEEIGFGRRLSQLGIVKYVRNAGCIHLGSNKVLCRGGGLFGIEIGHQCELYRFGSDRY